MTTSHSASVVALIALAVLCSNAASQCPCAQAASVVKIGVPCGAGAPTFNSTPPILGGTMTFFMIGAEPNAALLMAVSSPPAARFFTPGGCPLYLTPADLVLHGPFLTSALGNWFGEVFVPNDPALCGIPCNVQVIVQGSGGPDPFFRVTNAVQGTMGCAPGTSRNTIPDDAFCSYTQGGYAGGGVPGQLFDDNFLSTFPSGIEAGHYDTSGGNAAPNGLRWEGTTAGKAALESFLGGGGPSGPIASDQIDPLTDFGGGALAHQAVTLGLNVGFSGAGVTPAGFAGLVYVQPGDSLSGFTIGQILAIANDALAGLGLPAGQTFGSLAALLTDLNEAFDNCDESDWAGDHIFAP